MHLKVRNANAGNIRQKLLDLGVLEKNRRILRDREFVFFPVKEPVGIDDTEIVEITSENPEKMPISLKDALKGKFTENELKILPRAFDTIGDIAILEIPDELFEKREIIGNSLLSVFKSIKVVALKDSGVDTEFRTRKIRIIAGEKRTETIHREFDCVYKLDIQSAYFSPRLGTERMRVAKQVKGSERVLVMFAGVGPYAILIVKKSKPGEIYAIELNPDAFRYMKENIKLNKVDVIPILGDVREETRKLGKFDRIVMPLPKDAGNFLDVAIPALEKNGIIHFYDFSHNEEESIEKVKNICSELGYDIEILNAVKCGSYSPCLFRICVDFMVV